MVGPAEGVGEGGAEAVADEGGVGVDDERFHAESANGAGDFEAFVAQILTRRCPGSELALTRC